MANECIPVYEPGSVLTCHAAAALTGKRFCRVSAEPQGPLVTGLDTDADGGNIIVNVPVLNGQILGVVNRDVAIGGKVGVITQPGIIVPVTCSAAVAAGQEVSVDADGRIKPAAAGQHVVGMAVAGAAGGADAAIKLYGASRIV